MCDTTTLAELPISVWLPVTVAVTLITPAGSVVVVKLLLVSGKPSYGLLSLAAVIVIIAVVFSITVS